MANPELPHDALLQRRHQDPLKVLVVDDDKHIRTILQTMLSHNGFAVLMAADPAAAEEILSRQDVQLDAVLTDLHMGERTGLDVLNAAARLQPGASRILISAQVEVRAMMDAVNGVGVYAVVEKPVRHEDLLNVLDRACSMSRVVRERDALQHALQLRTRELESLNRMLEESVQRRTSDLLCGLLAALDWRDTETQAHSRRVSAYARRLGRRLGLSGSDLANCTAGALLHDIGKIGVPEAVLRKPTALTEEEWVLMQRHPALGDEMLAPIGILQGARRVVLQHHERFDGTGYPAGLSGHAIDLGARIFAVVDAHDAITSDRPHRRGRPVPVARDLVALAGGTQFDPEVVAAYVSVPDREWLDIADAYQDTGPFTGLGDLLSGL